MFTNLLDRRLYLRLQDFRIYKAGCCYYFIFFFIITNQKLQTITKIIKNGTRILLLSRYFY